MKRYSHDATQLIFREMDEQGRLLTWLSERLLAWEPELSVRVWPSRLSAYKAGRLVMPSDVIDAAAELLGISETVLSFFVLALQDTDPSLNSAA